MSATEERLHPIGTVSERTGLPAHTLRFYEQEDLLIEPVRRDAAGRRRYSERDVRWLRICETLRGTGMPIADLRRYVQAVRRGPGTVDERHELLRLHERRIRERIAELQQALGIVEETVATCGRRVADGSADRSWAEEPGCPPAEDG